MLLFLACCGEPLSMSRSPCGQKPLTAPLSPVKVWRGALPPADEFLRTNKDILKELPPPMVALNYYRNQDLYLFDEWVHSCTCTYIAGLLSCCVPLLSFGCPPARHRILATATPCCAKHVCVPGMPHPRITTRSPPTWQPNLLWHSLHQTCSGTHPLPQ